MKNTIIKKITKSIITFMMIGVTVIGASVAMPERVNALPLDYTLDHKADPNAPEVVINMSRTFFGMHGEVNQYKIQPGKYYILMKPGKSKMPTFNFRLVKVLDSYEEDTWYGSERTIKIRYCDTGRTDTVQPNKGLKPPHFYDVDDYLK